MGYNLLLKSKDIHFQWVLINLFIEKKKVLFSLRGKQY